MIWLFCSGESRYAGYALSIEDGKIKLRVILGQLQKQVADFCFDFSQPLVFAINFVNDDDRFES